jgi:hypothetical protein
VRPVVAWVAAALVLFTTAMPAQARSAFPREPGLLAAAEQQATQPDRPAERQAAGRRAAEKDGGDDGGGVPIWAGIGLILLAAAAGSRAARARNRRRMREYTGE